MWFQESNSYFCKIGNFAYREINKWNFSDPPPLDSECYNRILLYNVVCIKDIWHTCAIVLEIYDTCRACISWVYLVLYCILHISWFFCGKCSENICYMHWIYLYMIHGMHVYAYMLHAVLVYVYVLWEYIVLYIALQLVICDKYFENVCYMHLRRMLQVIDTCDYHVSLICTDLSICSDSFLQDGGISIAIAVLR